MFYYAQTVAGFCCGVQSSEREITAPGLVAVSEQECLDMSPLNCRRVNGEWQKTEMEE